MTTTDTDDSLEGVLWPNVARVCLGPGSDLRLNASVAWVQERKEFFAYVEGYHRAAVTLFNSLDGQPQGSDYLIWPLAYLWRHFIELSLKDIIAAGRKLAGDLEPFPTHHRLAELWREAREHIVAIADPEMPELEYVDANIKEFERVDPTGEGFRYPLKKRASEMSLREPPDQVNLRSLHEGMEALASFFDAVRMDMSVRLDISRPPGW